MEQNWWQKSADSWRKYFILFHWKCFVQKVFKLLNVCLYKEEKEKAFYPRVQLDVWHCTHIIVTSEGHLHTQPQHFSAHLLCFGKCYVSTATNTEILDLEMGGVRSQRFRLILPPKHLKAMRIEINDLRRLLTLGSRPYVMPHEASKKYNSLNCLME